MKVPEKPTVCIVRLINGIQSPQINFQAILDPDKVSGNYIRLEGPGNDLMGWFNLDDLILEHTVGIQTPDGKGWVAVESCT